MYQPWSRRFPAIRSVPTYGLYKPPVASFRSRGAGKNTMHTHTFVNFGSSSRGSTSPKASIVFPQTNFSRYFVVPTSCYENKFNILKLPGVQGLLIGSLSWGNPNPFPSFPWAAQTALTSCFDALSCRTFLIQQHWTRWSGPTPRSTTSSPSTGIVLLYPPHLRNFQSVKHWSLFVTCINSVLSLAPMNVNLWLIITGYIHAMDRQGKGSKTCSL